MSLAHDLGIRLASPPAGILADQMEAMAARNAFMGAPLDPDTPGGVGAAGLARYDALIAAVRAEHVQRSVDFAESDPAEMTHLLVASIGAGSETVAYLEGKIKFLEIMLRTQALNIDILMGLAGIKPLVLETPPDPLPSPPAPMVGALGQ